MISAARSTHPTLETHEQAQQQNGRAEGNGVGGKGRRGGREGTGGTGAGRGAGAPQVSHKGKLMQFTVLKVTPVIKSEFPLPVLLVVFH